jgi:signal transduction histidine kinase
MSFNAAMWLPALSTCLALLLAAAAWRARRRARLALLALAESRGREQALERLARMTASDLRVPALNLLGQASQLNEPARSALVGVCRSLLDTAETILEETDRPDARRRLREEPVALGPLVAFAMSQVAAQLGPGSRVWRVAPGLDQVVVQGDRRALHQVLLRVLTGAALASAEGDAIDIAPHTSADAWTLRVEDEGTGLAVAGTAGAGTETRGLGLGLALARSLMQAHGGSLDLQSASLVGTRALIRFPRSRIVKEAVLF